MSRKFLVLLAAVLACASVTGCTKGSDGSAADENACQVIGATEKIINGDRCEGFTRSPVVRLLTQFSDNTIGVCTGTIITPNKILTATHCVVNIQNGAGPTSIMVISGDAGQDTTYYAEDFAFHPGFRAELPDKLFNDVAVVTLSSYTSIPPAPVLVSQDAAIGSTAYIYGFGQSEVDPEPPTSLQEWLDSSKELRASNMTVAEITNNHYWAVFTSNSGMVCYGDSGGPLIVERPTAMVLGVTSQLVTPDGTCDVGTTALWTRLQSSEVQNWLRQVAPEADYR